MISRLRSRRELVMKFTQNFDAFSMPDPRWVVVETRHQLSRSSALDDGHANQDGLAIFLLEDKLVGQRGLMNNNLGIYIYIQ